MTAHHDRYNETMFMTSRDLQLLREKYPVSQDVIALTGLTDGVVSPCAPPPEPGKRIRQSHKPLMNKLESVFYDYLRRQWPGARIYIQALRFKLGNGIWYCPDFVTQLPWPLLVKQVAYEVKGPHAFRGGFENLKVAAGLYPDTAWVLVWKEGGAWKVQEVLP